MTAPAITAPAAPAAPTANLSVTEMMSKVASATKVAPDPVPPMVPDVRFTRDPAPVADAAPVADPAAPSAEAPVVEGAPVVEAATEPTGEIALEEDGITLRSERNADGTFKAKLDPTQKMDLEFKDKETGEIRRYTKTMPEILRLAKDGVALQPLVQKLKPEVEYFRENVPKWESEFKSLEQQLRDQVELNRELLTADDALVIQRREEYASEMSPQKRLERLEAERRAERDAATRSTEQRQRAAQARTFIETRIAPVIADAESKLGVDAVSGRIARATASLLDERGQIPPSAWPEVEQYINGPFKTWVATEAAKKNELETARAETAAAKKAADDAQRRAQALANESGRAMAPIGRAGAESAPQRPDPKSSNPRDVLNRINNRPLPTTVQPATV